MSVKTECMPPMSSTWLKPYGANAMKVTVTKQSVGLGLIYVFLGEANHTVPLQFCPTIWSFSSVICSQIVRMFQSHYSNYTRYIELEIWSWKNVGHMELEICENPLVLSVCTGLYNVHTSLPGF